MAKFCRNCGAALSEEDVVCTSCGQKYVGVQPPPPPPMHHFGDGAHPPVCPPPPPPMGPRPPVPGRALGIASMVMGIYSVLSTFGLFYAMYLIWYVEDKAGLTGTLRGDVNETIWEVLLPCFFALFILAALSLVFSLVAKYKGYRNGISNTGMALSVPSLVLWLVGLIFLLA